MFRRLFKIINNQNGNTVGQAVTGIIGGIAGFFIAGPVGAWKGALLGLGIGLTIGGILFPPDMQSQKMQPGTLQIQSSQYGIPVPVLYGARKIAGNLIWYGNFQTHEHYEESSGGKGGGGGGGVTSYTYSVGLAFGLCMAPAGRRMYVRKAWAGKDEIDLSKLTIYTGAQLTPDSYIAGFTNRDPVWKNLCYVVLRDYDLGNSTSIPNFTFEITDEGTYAFVNKFGSLGSGDGQLDWPQGIAVDSSYIYVVDYNNFRVQIFNKTTYAFVNKFGSFGSGDGQFSNPYNIAIDDNYIYVADSGNFRVQIFNKTTYAFVNKFGSLGSGDGQFNWPLGIAVDSSYIYVVDYSLFRVQIFNKTTYAFVNKFGSVGSGDGQFNYPYNIAIDDNYIYVADSGNNRVQLFEPKLEDMFPSNITQDILTNDLYGLGLDISTLDLTAFAATRDYCDANSLLVSLVFDHQLSVLDALQHIISHHNGYISYFDGVIAHKQLKSETPLSTLTTADTVKEDNDFPVQIARKGGRDYNNKVIVEYTKREQEYIAGTAAVDDMVDIDKHGLKDVSVKLDGITLYPMASKMANLLLKKSLANPESYSFKLGPKSIGIKPGEVHELTDAGVELSAQPIRIETISESDDYRIEVGATEELDVYDLIAGGSDTTTPPSAPELFGDPGSVVNPLSMEAPALYSLALCQAIILHSKSASPSWSGASLYKAYSEAGSYNRLASASGSGITGTVNAVGSLNDTAYIVLVLDWDATLSSALDFNDLITTPGKNLLFVRTSSGDKFIKYQTVELLAEKTWRLSGLIYDLVNIPRLNTYGAVAAADKAGFYFNIPHTLILNDADKFRTLYFKTPSFNFGGLEQSLADVSASSQAIAALCDTPLKPCNIKINSLGVTEGGSIIIPAGDISITWKSRNRFNAGAANFSRTDTIVEDADFVNFELEIYNGSTLLRTNTQTAKSYTYTIAQQTVDGGPYSAYTLKIRQINTLVSSGQETANITTI